jgi:hypothetical protein
MAMNCRDLHDNLPDYLSADPDSPQAQAMNEHVQACADCARMFRETQDLLAMLRPRIRAGVSPAFKDRVMNTITHQNHAEFEPSRSSRPRARSLSLRLALVAALLLLCLAGGALFLQYRPGGSSGGAPRLAGLALLNQAMAAEHQLFQRQGVVHLTNRITVRAVDNPELAGMRWLPMSTLKPDGSIRFDQLQLPAKPGESYAVLDESWFNSTDGKFARALRVDRRTIFAIAYDGHDLYTMQPGAGGSAIEKQAVTDAFKPPEDPAKLLGISAGLPTQLDQVKDEMITDMGVETPADGAAVRVLKCAVIPGDDRTCWLFRVRQDDHTITSMEWLADGRSLLSIERMPTEVVDQPAVAWDLKGLESAPAKDQRNQGVAMQKDMVIPGVTVEHMVQRANFETYLFAANPSWAGERYIVDVFDPATPGGRMFLIAHRAGDGRHVVLVQSPTYNKMLGPMLAKAQKVYHSPNGFEVYGVPQPSPIDLAAILLTSSRAWIKDPPAANRIAYFLKSPAGTIPALAINGTLSEAEMHALIDSLVSARSLVAPPAAKPGQP